MIEQERQQPDTELPSDPTMTMRPRPVRAAGPAPEPGDAARARPDSGSDEGESSFAGRRGFRLLHLIGRGGHGEVWEARQESLGRLVAVKRLPPEELDPENSEMDPPCDQASLELAFRQEALITAHLEHPNIVPVHDLGRDEAGRPLLAMKLLRGQTWDQMILEDFERLDPTQFLGRHLPILADLAQAVAFAHARGVVHRDLKPSQVMVGEFGEVLLMDWGLAVAFDPESLARSSGGGSRRSRRGGGRLSRRPSLPDQLGPVIPTLETASNPAGTPAYMAPEQTEKDAANIGPWTDVYLLGGILYFLLTGTPPHNTGNSKAAFARARTGIVEPPAERVRRRPVPPELGRLAMEALRACPAERPQGGARSFVRAVQDYLTGATRRKESEALVRQVASRLRAARGDYEVLTELSGLLDNARALWPDNPDARQLRERVLEETVEAAIAHGDLTLARVQAVRLEPGVTRRQMLAHIGAVEAAVSRRERQRRTALRAVGVLVAVLALIAMIDFDARRADARERMQQAFDRAAGAQARSLSRAVTRALDAVHATAGLFAASYDVSPEEFSRFTRPLLERQKEVLVLEWIPRVPVNSRIDFELSMRACGLSEFAIFEMDGSATTASASLRPYYYPVVYAEPAEDPGNVAALGFDMGSSLLRLEAMTQAVTEGQAVATGRVRLVQDPDGPYGFLVFVPVFQPERPLATEAQRRDAVRGFVAAAMRPVDLLAQAAATSQPSPVAVDLYDDGAPRLESRLVLQGSGLRDLDGEPKDAIHFSTTIEVPGRQWHFVATPTAEFLTENHLPRRPWALFAGAGVVLILAACIASDLHESRRITKLIQDRDLTEG